MKSKRSRLEVFPSVFFMLGLVALTGPALSEDLIIPGEVYQVEPPVERTHEEMMALEVELKAAGVLDELHEVVIPFRVTGMTQEEYEREKERSEGAPQILLDESRIEGLGFDIEPLAPPVRKALPFSGVNQGQAGGLIPPDTDGAIGIGHYCQVTNTHLDCFWRAAGHGNLKSISLNAFFGYPTETIFDPRIAFDPIWKRWIVSAEAFPEAPANIVQRHFIGVSRTHHPNSAYYIYSIDVNTPNDPNFFWDYPQLAFDQDAIIVTANVFGLPQGTEAWSFAWPKARVYNGLGFFFYMRTGLNPTIAPSLVLDQNANAYMIVTPNYSCSSPGSTVYKYTYTSAGRVPGETLTQSTITLPSAYCIPPNASQPGTNIPLDTIDNRCVNRGTQVGNSVFQTHTVGTGSFPTPRYYEFDPVANTVTDWGWFWASGTSHDWMSSIAANPAGDIFVTWSSTDAPNGINAQLRFSGKESTDPGGLNLGPGQAEFTSTTFYTSGYNPPTRPAARWGDYTYTSLDSTRVAQGYDICWGTGQYHTSSTFWRSGITIFGY